MKIFLDVFGCRLNQSEVEAFANTFRALGHEIVAEPGIADLAIVNTCAVTVKAAADSLQPFDGLLRGHSLDQGGDSLQITAAAAQDPHIPDNALVIHFHLHLYLDFPYQK